MDSERFEIFSRKHFPDVGGIKHRRKVSLLVSCFKG
jgi:hypothetical protein